MNEMKKPFNKYLDISGDASGVIYSTRFGDGIYTFRRCEHGNRKKICGCPDDSSPIGILTDCMKCIRKGKTYRIVPPPHPISKEAFDTELERFGSYPRTDTHLELNDRSKKYLWGFDTIDGASALQDIYFGD